MKKINRDLQIVPQCPLIRFKDDNSGGYNRLKRKLTLFGLKFEVDPSPTSGKSAVDDAIRDFVEVCRKEGVQVPDPHVKCMTFTALVKHMEGLGLFGVDFGQHGDGNNDPDAGSSAVDNRGAVCPYSQILF